MPIDTIIPRTRAFAAPLAAACALAVLLTAPARAEIPVELDVTYTGCTIVSGPLSLGLASLPSTIPARFIFLSPTWPPPNDGSIFEPELVFAELRLGDLLTTRPNVEYFRIAFFPDLDGGSAVSQLTWLGVKDSTDTACGLDHPNSSFQIDFTGTTREPGEPCPEGGSLTAGSQGAEGAIVARAGEAFHYHCSGSNQSFSQATSSNISVFAKKLTVTSRPDQGKGKTVLTIVDSSVAKGTGTDADEIAAHLSIAYTGTSGAATGELAAGQGVLEKGDRSGWKENSTKQAKYQNKDAPAGTGGGGATKKTQIKPAKGLKLIAKSEGDTPLDLLGAGAPTGSGVTVVYTVVNSGEMIRHCMRFAASRCTYKELAGGAGARLACKDGGPDVCP